MKEAIKDEIEKIVGDMIRSQTIYVLYDKPKECHDPFVGNITSYGQYIKFSDAVVMIMDYLGLKYKTKECTAPSFVKPRASK